MMLLLLAAGIAACLVAWSAAFGVKWEGVALLSILAAAAGAAWLNVVDRFLDFVTWLMVFCAPITLDVELFHRIGEDPIVNLWPASPTLAVPDLLCYLLYLAWGLEIVQRRADRTPRLGWTALWACGLLAAGAASIAVSRDPTSSLIEWSHTVHYVLIFIYLSKRVSNRVLLQWLLISIAFQCWINVLVSTLQYTTKSSLGLDFLGERASVKTFDTPDGAEARAGGLMGHPNNLALYFVLVGPIAMAKVLEYGLKLPMRLFWIVTLLLTEFGLLITFSRAGWLCSATCALMIFHASQRRRGRPWLISFGLPVLAGIIAFVMLFFLWSDFQQRLTAEDYGSTETRWQQFRTALNVIQHLWWCGTGIGAYTEGAWRFNEGFGDARNVLYRVHNGSLLVTAELGIWGGIAYHAWAFLIAKRGWQLVRTLRDEELWTIALGCFWGLAGWFAKSMYNVHTPLADVNLWYVAALLLIVANCANRSNGAWPKPTGSSVPGQDQSGDGWPRDGFVPGTDPGTDPPSAPDRSR